MKMKVTARIGMLTVLMFAGFSVVKDPASSKMTIGDQYLRTINSPY